MGTWVHLWLILGIIFNRFKELDPIDKLPEELWMEVLDIVQMAMIKTVPEKKKCNKAKWLSKETLQIAEKRKEAKDKGEKERYMHLMQSSKE